MNNLFWPPVNALLMQCQVQFCLSLQGLTLLSSVKLMLLCRTTMKIVTGHLTDVVDQNLIQSCTLVDISNMLSMSESSKDIL